MTLQGHIESGAVVLDEPAGLPDGTRVRVEPVPSKDESACPDTDKPYTVGQTANAWKAIATPVVNDGAGISVAPDDFPLF